MGMEHVVQCALRTTISWKALSELLDQRGFPVQVRMINGELAFPDEVPPDDWSEVRVGTAQGMVTLRRQDNRVLVITWGNADKPMREAWNGLAWAVAEASDGRIAAGDAVMTAAEFRKQVELPATLRG